MPAPLAAPIVGNPPALTAPLGPIAAMPRMHPKTFFVPSHVAWCVTLLKIVNPFLVGTAAKPRVVVKRAISAPKTVGFNAT